MIKHYLNLTNGIAWLKQIQETKEPYSFIRIQSTTLERKDYIKLFQDLDHDLLLHLALGWECVIYDCGTNRPFSKTIYTGVPLIRYILNRRWFGTFTDQVFRLNRDGSKGANVSEYYDFVYRNLFEYEQNKEKTSLKKKLDYYKRYLGCKEIMIEGKSISTDKDGNYPYFAEILKTYEV